MGTAPYFAHKWNRTLATKLRLYGVSQESQTKKTYTNVNKKEIDKSEM